MDSKKERDFNMEKQTGCVHIYCGDGKGKTTCGMGLCTRAAGYGYRVLIYQFMKDNSTSERKVLLLSPNVTFVPGQDKIKFSFLMTPEEKAEQKRYYEGAAHQTVCFQSYKPARPETVHRILPELLFLSLSETALHNTVSALPSPPVSSETKTLSVYER